MGNWISGGVGAFPSLKSWAVTAFNPLRTFCQLGITAALKVKDRSAGDASLSAAPIALSAPKDAAAAERLAAAPTLPVPSEVASTQETLCIFWDLEATGLGTKTDEITEIGSVAMVFSRGGHWIDTGMRFRTYVTTTRPVPLGVEKLTGISNDLLSSEGVPFDIAIGMWRDWILSVKNAWQEAARHLWFIAHSGTRFDMPLLFSQEKRAGSKAGALFRSVKCTGVVDSYLVARRLGIRRGSLSLGDLYRSAVGYEMEGRHSALGDAFGLAEVMKHDPFLSEWQEQPIAYTLKWYCKNNQERW